MEAQGGCSGAPGSFRLRDLKQKQPEVRALTKWGRLYSFEWFLCLDLSQPLIINHTFN